MLIDLLTALRKLEAQLAVGASTARGQGAKGVVKRLRKSLAKTPLGKFSGVDEFYFSKILDAETERIFRDLPAVARSWGLARKCLNIYLRDCVYNTHLRAAFNLASVEEWLEVPLDRNVVTALKAEFPKRFLPHWRGVRHVDPGESEVFQVAASEVAKAWSIDRIHLDAFFWAR